MFKKKIAFTLAEILVVISIIGIVGAFAVPHIKENANQQTYITGLAKAYANLNRAIREMQYSKGRLIKAETPEYWTEKVFGAIMKPLAITTYGLKDNDGIEYLFLPDEYGSCKPIFPQDLSEFSLSEICGPIIVDVNGTKGPNKLTKSNIKHEIYDRFVLFLYPKGVHLGPYGNEQILNRDFAQSKSASNYVSGTSPEITTVSTSFISDIEKTLSENLLEYTKSEK